MNFALCLSLSRIVLSFVFMLCLTSPTLLWRALALFFFILAALTDIYDGIWARSRNMVTSFGVFLDPLADKILVSAAFISFVGMKELSIPAWMVVIIISREFAVMGLRLLALSRGEILGAEKEGKQKTALQMGTVLVILVYLILKTSPAWNETFDMWAKLGIYFSMWATLILTVLSGYSYFRRQRDVFTGRKL